MQRSQTPARQALDTVLAEHQVAARAHLEPLWQALGQALEERMAACASALNQRLAEVLAEEREAGRREGRRELAEQLGQAVRRLRQADNLSEWAAALLDATTHFCDLAIVLAVRDETFAWVASRGLSPSVCERFAGWQEALQMAPALASTVSAGEPLAASLSPEELSSSLAEALGDAQTGHVWLLPVWKRGRVAAVVVAGGGETTLDPGGLELVAAMAGMAPGGAEWPPLEAPAPPVKPAGQPPRALPEWSQLSREDQELHLRAQRFARVQVAEMRLHQSQAVRNGRTRGDLYGALKTEIDAAREAFRAQFLGASPTMVDYLHRELVRTLAHEDAALLGKDYPGPLV